MDLRDTVETQVAAAFDLLGTLKQSITFSVASNRDYDFDTGEVSESTTSITLDGVVEYITIEGGGASSNVLGSLQAKFILNKADFLENYNQFDSFTTDGKTYKILEFKDNGYSLEGTGVGG